MALLLSRRRNETQQATTAVALRPAEKGEICRARACPKCASKQSREISRVISAAIKANRNGLSSARQIRLSAMDMVGAALRRQQAALITAPVVGAGRHVHHHLRASSSAAVRSNLMLATIGMRETRAFLLFGHLKRPGSVDGRGRRGRMLARRRRRHRLGHAATRPLSAHDVVPCCERALHLIGSRRATPCTRTQ